MTTAANPHGVLILGSPRSGTTWSSEILGTAPGASLVHEPDNEVNDGYALIAKIGLGRFPAADAGLATPRYRRLWAEAFTPAERVDGPTASAVRKLMQKTPRPVRDGVLEGSTDRKARALRATLERLAQPKQGLDAGGPIIVKSVHAAFSAETIARIAEPRVVIIQRHPLNVLSSWIEFDWPPQRLEDRPELLELAGIADVEPFQARTDNERRAMSYAVLHRRFDRLLEDHPDWVSADHDDICLDPMDRFRKLFSDLALEWTAATEAAIVESDAPGAGYDTRRVASEQRDRWRARLDDATVAELVAVLDHYGVALPTDR